MAPPRIDPVFFRLLSISRMRNGLIEPPCRCGGNRVLPQNFHLSSGQIGRNLTIFSFWGKSSRDLTVTPSFSFRNSCTGLLPRTASSQQILLPLQCSHLFYGSNDALSVTAAGRELRTKYVQRTLASKQGVTGKNRSSQWRSFGSLVSGAICAIMGAECLTPQLELQPARMESSNDSDESLLPALVATKLAEEFFQELKSICDEERIVLDEDERILHGKPLNTYHKLDMMPDVVVHPTTSEEVAAVVKLCNRYKVPIVAYGGATSLEGHTVAPNGGVSLDMNSMKEVKALHLDDMDVVVEPGIGWMELNEYLKPYGLFFPLDPGPGATIGGMCSTRCSGSLAVRYGTMRENVISLKPESVEIRHQFRSLPSHYPRTSDQPITTVQQVVMANGDVVKTASRARKSSAGYDLTRLLVGSEGTLGVITEVTLRLQKIPEATTVAMCNFPTIRDAANVAIDIMHSGIQASRIELLDDEMMKAINMVNGTTYSEQVTLMFELIGTEAYVLEQTNIVKAVAEKHQASEFVYAVTPEAKDELWKVRKEAYWAAISAKPDSEAMTTDVCVPLSKLAECISTAKSQLDASQLMTSIISHAGDGNFHTVILFDPNSTEERDEAHRLADDMVQTALALEGTCTGEHGVGIGKVKYLEKEHGREAVQVMGTIKGALDPANIMNPGKVIPPQFCY